MGNPAFRLSDAELAAEREAWRMRQARTAAAPRPASNPQFAGLHMGMPRTSLGAGGYIVDVRKGTSVWR